MLLCDGLIVAQIFFKDFNLKTHNNNKRLNFMDTFCGQQEEKKQKEKFMETKALSKNRKKNLKK